MLESAAQGTERTTIMRSEDPSPGQTEVKCKQIARHSTNKNISFWLYCPQNQIIAEATSGTDRDCKQTNARWAPHNERDPHLQQKVQSTIDKYWSRD